MLTDQCGNQSTPRVSNPKNSIFFRFDQKWFNAASAVISVKGDLQSDAGSISRERRVYICDALSGFYQSLLDLISERTESSTLMDCSNAMLEGKLLKHLMTGTS